MSQRKRRHRPDEPTPEQSDEMWQQMAMLTVTIEAAGGFERAMRLTNMNRDDPGKVEQMRGFVPVSRGGDDGSDEKEAFWRELLEETTGSLEGRRILHEMREQLNDVEIQQAEETSEKPDEPRTD